MAFDWSNIWTPGARSRQQYDTDKATLAAQKSQAELNAKLQAQIAEKEIAAKYDPEIIAQRQKTIRITLIVLGIAVAVIVYVKYFR